MNAIFVRVCSSEGRKAFRREKKGRVRKRRLSGQFELFALHDLGKVDWFRSITTKRRKVDPEKEEGGRAVSILVQELYDKGDPSDISWMGRMNSNRMDRVCDIRTVEEIQVQSSLDETRQDRDGIDFVVCNVPAIVSASYLDPP